MAVTKLSGGSSAGNGDVGIDSSIGTEAGKRVNEAVSRANLEVRAQDNASVKGAIEAVQKMVSNWPVSTQMEILETYGNYQNLPRRPSREQLSNEVAMTIISHLSKEEIKKIIGQMDASEKSLSNAISKAQTSSKQLSKNYFKRQLEDNSNASGANTPGTTAGLQKMLNTTGSMYDKKILTRSPKLASELKDLLSGYTNSNLVAEAMRCGVDYKEGTARKILIDAISSRCLAYYVMTTTSDKGVGAPMALDQVDAIEELLQMTSFSWVTGKAGLTDKTIAQKRKNARLALDKTRAYAKAESQKNKNFKIDKHGNFKTYLHTGALKFKLGGNRGGKYYSTLVKSHILDTYSYDKLISTAQSLGLDTTLVDENDSASIDTLKNNIYHIMALQQQEVAKNEKNVSSAKQKYENSGLLFRKSRLSKYEAAKRGLKATDQSTLLSQIANPTATQETSSEIPVVSLDANGNIHTSDIVKAVPVIVVGQHTGGHIMNAKDLENADKSISDNNKGSSLYKRLSDMESSLSNNGKTNASTDLNENIVNSLINQPNDALSNLKNNIPTKIGSGGGDSGLSAGALLATYSNTMNIATKFANNMVNQHQLNAQNKPAFFTYDNKRRISNNTINLATKANSALISTAVGKCNLKLKKSDIKPVYVINKGLDESDKITEIANSENNISEYISSLYTAMAGLQSVGTSVNTAAATSTVAAALVSASQSYANAVKSATGATMRGYNTRSNIITGDSPTNKNNTEMVSVDWGSRQINVKPIPKMATGGSVDDTTAGANSGVSSVQRLTSGQRNTPLSVGISTGLVTYGKTFSDVTDDTTNTAVKVYSVNTGINDKITVGNSSFSLFELVYGIYTGISTLTESISTSNKLLATIGSNSSKSQNSSTSSTGSFEFSHDLDSVLAGD